MNGSIGGVVLAILLVGAAYIAAHVVVDRLQRRFLVMAGAEYVLLGLLLGPAVAQIRAFDDLTPIMPGIALTAGWVGLLRGTELNLFKLGSTPDGTIRVVLVHHLVTGFVVGVGAWLTFSWLGLDVGWRQQALACAVLGCCAAAHSAGPIDLLGRRYELDDGIVPLLRRSALLGDLLVIFVFGVMFCVFHEGQPSGDISLRATEWAVVSVGLGAVLGALFTAFLVGDESPNGRFLALVGIICFASGSAWFLRIDPLLVNLVLGIVLVNTARSGHRVHDTLENTERPLSLVLLVLAGALWRPPELVPAVVGAGVFLVLRTAGKALASGLAGWGTPLRRDLFRGLLGQGDVTVAMAVSYRLVYQGPAVDVAYTIILAAVVLNDLVAPRLLRSLLVDAGDIRGDKPGEPTAASEAREGT